MPLTLAPLTLSDFDTLSSYSHLTDGDLSAPFLPLVWPATDPTSASARNSWSIAQQRRMFLEDPTATFLKVTDTDLPGIGDGKGEMIALARWHFYPDGYHHTQQTIEWECRSPLPWPKEGVTDEEKAVGLLSGLFEARRGWFGEEPQWILTTLKTREGHQKRGAGGLLVDWGIQRAEKDGVPAFLESSPKGASLYKKHGFKILGMLEGDLPAQLFQYQPASKVEP